MLNCLQEDGWPERMDNPFPGATHRARRAKLHDAVQKLNRNQKLIRFVRDGSGEGVGWESLR